MGVHDLSNIYRVPLLLNAQGVTRNILSRLLLVEKPNVKMWNEWRSLAELVDSLDIPVSVAVVGKYTDLSDAYLSISKVRPTLEPTLDSTPSYRALLPTPDSTPSYRALLPTPDSTPSYRALLPTSAPLSSPPLLGP